MKIYTRTGDSGTTSLFSGERVMKNVPRVEAYGTVDELNAHLGLAAASSPAPETAPILIRLQNQLFALCADLATPDGTRTIRRMAPEDITELEAEIDAMAARTPPLKSFVLPGGTPCAAALHVARCVCRRAERKAMSCSDLNPYALTFLNRLSDHLFVLARYENALGGQPETPWIPCEPK